MLNSLLRKLIIIVILSSSVQTCMSQELFKIESFINKDAAFFENYFSSKKELHNLEGVYLVTWQVYNTDGSVLFSELSKRVFIELNNIIYVLDEELKETNKIDFKNTEILVYQKNSQKPTFQFYGKSISDILETKILFDQFKTSVYLEDEPKFEYEKSYSTIEAIGSGVFQSTGKLSTKIPKATRTSLERIFPRKSSKKSALKSSVISEGTMFQINDNCFVTNFHVVKDAMDLYTNLNNQKIQLIVVAKDVKNDLAIVKLSKKTVKLTGSPLSIKKSKILLGSPTLTLGYPMSSTMGESIKASNGIISSKRGFKDDLSTFQTTAPVHPGSSGGPVFDNYGNVIGVISSRHAVAENSSYAIRANILINLLEEYGLDYISKINTTEKVDINEMSKSVFPIVAMIKS